MQLLNRQRHCYREISYLITSIHACKYNPLIFFFFRTIYYFSTSLLPFTPHLLYILSYSFHLYQRSQFLSFLFIFSCITSLPISRLLMINLSGPHPSLGFHDASLPYSTHFSFLLKHYVHILRSFFSLFHFIRNTP